MASSLLRTYTSADAGGPGQLTGEANTLNVLLRAILVDGYGAYPAAGWTEPIATAGNIAAFQQGAGSGFHMLINDNGPNGTSTFKEAWVTGWETLAGIGAPVGTGSGQFPTPAQLLTTGHGVVRKSNTADAVGRDWIAFADDRTLYLFIASGDTAGWYTMLFFGDFFSVYNLADAYSCMLAARTLENSTANNIEGFGTMVATPTTAALGGFFLARTYTGGGASLPATCQGDAGRTNNTVYTGLVQYPNGPDNSLYLSPVWIYEPAAGVIRGRMRGLYHVCHAATSFADGQQFTGAGDYAGKTIQIVKLLFSRNSGTQNMIGVEVSNTTETN